MVDQTFKVTVDPFFDGTENEIGLSQEYPISEIKMEMVVCRNLGLPEPGQDEAAAAQRQKHESDDEVLDREDEGCHEMNEEDENTNGEFMTADVLSPVASVRITSAD